MVRYSLQSEVKCFKHSTKEVIEFGIERESIQGMHFNADQSKAKEVFFISPFSTFLMRSKACSATRGAPGSLICCCSEMLGIAIGLPSLGISSGYPNERMRNQNTSWGAFSITAFEKREIKCKRVVECLEDSSFKLSQNWKTVSGCPCMSFKKKQLNQQNS